MSRDFSIRTMFHTTPSDAFKAFFAALGIEVPANQWNYRRMQDVIFMDSFFKSLLSAPVQSRRKMAELSDTQYISSRCCNQIFLATFGNNVCLLAQLQQGSK